jgi:hypothetical protein
MHFLSTIRKHFEAGDKFTIVTPFGIAEGKVIALDEEEGTFTFQSPSPKPFKMYLIDLLFVVEG